LFRALTLGLLLLTSPPGPAQSGTSLAGPKSDAPAQPAERPTPEAAMALAEAMSPRGLMIAKEQAAFREQFPAELRKQEEFAEMEAEYPTLVAELQRAMEQPFGAYMNRMFDKFIPEIAKLIGENISASEVAQLTAFYRSPAGQRTLQGMVENSNTQEIVDSIGNGGQPDEAMLRRQISGAATKTSKSLSEADRNAVVELMMTPGFWSLAKIQKQLLALKLQMLNAEDPQFNQDTEEVFERVMARLIEAKETSQ
jgi:hypothetical protein